MGIQWLPQLHGLLGVLTVLALCVAMSNQRRRIDWKLVLWGLVLQFVFAALVIVSKPGQAFFAACDHGINRLLDFSREGTGFLLKSFDTNAVEPAVKNLAFEALPTVIFFSALLSTLYYIGIMPRIVRGIAWLMMRTMGTSGAETLSVAGDIFVGQTEAPLLVKPFIETMTRSELNTVMCGGFATIAGGVMGLYVSWLDGRVPNIGGHLMAASVMSAPAAIVISKIIVPEVEVPITRGGVPIEVENSAGNLIEAIGDGATDGMKLLLNMAAMLLAFVALMTMANAGLAALGGWLGSMGVSTSVTNLFSLDALFGKLFQPLAWTLGVSWQEAEPLGRLLGKKLVLTELVAYHDLSEMKPGEVFSERSAIIASYALCGFANFASIGVQLGGTGAMAPSRKKDLSALALRAMIGGALATCLTAAVAGLFLPFPPTP
jgi:CNT family concentrative nucleoside transporter